MNMKKFLTKEEIQKLLEMEPNTCWSRAHEILNSERSKNGVALLNRSWFFEGFLKRHGCRDGKMRGFKYNFKPEVKETSVEEVKPNLDNISVKEEIKQEVKENPVVESVAELLSTAALIVLKLLYHNRFDKPCMKELLKKFPQYSWPLVKKAWDELKHNGYFTKSSPESKRFLPMDWERCKRDLPELMIPLKDGEDSCILKKVTAKVEPQKVEKPMPYKSVLKESLYYFLDNLNVPYAIRELAAAFPDLDSENIQALQDRMLDEGILVDTPSGYCPSYDWRIPVRSERKNPFKEIPQILPQKKDFILVSSKIRIVNESGREIKITITDTEVILKV